MKKITLIGIAMIVGTMAFSLSALAATTASFTPASVKVATGQQFNMVVMVDPAGTKNYAEKIEVDFPADTLEVISFTLGNGGMALSQPGYDSLDNTNGVMIKTAGYAGGISSPTLIGTILFTAKKSGSGTIKIGSQSAAFQVSGQSAISGASASFTVSSAIVSLKKSPATALAPVTTINGQTVVATATPTTTVDLAPTSQTAAVDTSSTGGSNTWLWVIIIVLILIIIVIYVVSRKKKI